MAKPVVAIIGRPNVGKSTLFNRIVGRRHAIVDDQPGVTRDRNELEVEWCGRPFVLVDTGGYTTADDAISRGVLSQVFQAIEEADVLIFVCDVRAGITDVDYEVADVLRKKAAGKTLLLAVNKVDSDAWRPQAEEFRKLGLGEPFFIAGEQGLGVAELLDAAVQAFPAYAVAEPADTNAVKLAVVGRPNVGKSSFVNAILGEERQIVTDIAGTTRDAIDTPFRRNGQAFILIDTAGLRRRAKVEEDIEFFSATRTEKALERADVAIVLIDAQQGLEKQDLRIINMALERKCGVLIAINKWDLIEKDANTAQTFTQAVAQRLKNLSYLPIITVSALTKQRVFKAVDLAREIWAERRRRIETSELNRVLLPEIQRTPPWSKSGKEIKVKYITQLAIEPPLFAFYAGNAKLVEESYKKFVERLIRDKFGFKGVPIEVQFRQK
ncbi:MAG: ribosome biogenesis GTPase Der [Chloroherpetonaceae bacterium]|nr:ribosome biogenesis GTPase Der [Chloroherpetonaceae bacterium]MCS7212486.1 ribosome biogenesis GTPase Der [Chloroherpetonaceae bacterium]MDW8020190.1 ribosome biogenesis GTPase Der [Chloroherpetonaceae bacterium]